MTKKSLETRVAELELALDNLNLTAMNKLQELQETIDAMKTTSPGRDRGPKSDREMTEDDARKVMIGEFKDLTHKAAAEKLGLSYGQIYSARGGYTFKKVYKEMEDLKKSPARRQEDTKIN
jgi:hypothetical protein